MKLTGAQTTDILIHFRTCQEKLRGPYAYPSVGPGEERRALEEFLERVNEIVNLVGTNGNALPLGRKLFTVFEGIDVPEEPTGRRPEAPCDNEQGADSGCSPSPFDIPEGVGGQSAGGSKFL